MLQKPIITDWTAGELSPLMAGRVELEIFNKGCSKLENWLVLRQGCITTRPAMKYIAEAKGPARLIPFIVDASNSFILEMGPRYIRVYKNDDQPLMMGDSLFEIQTPYATIQHIREIQIAQDADTLYFAHTSYRPSYLKVENLATWTFGTIDVTGNAGDLPFQPLGTGDDAGNWPGTVAIFGGRLWFGGTPNEPQTVWASETWDYTSFLYSDTISVTTKQYKDPATWANPDKPELEDVTTTKEVTTDSSAMKFSLGSDQLERILWMASGRDLVIGGSTSEFIVPAGVSALSPAARQQTRNGSAKVQGLMLKDSVVFVQGDGKHILDYQYSNDQGSYLAPDLTFHAEGVLGTGVVDMDFTQTPQPMLFCVRSDGQLAVLVQDKVYQVQAWSRFITDGAFESIAVSQGATGEDVIYAIVLRGSKRLIERFDPLRMATPVLDSYTKYPAGTVSLSGLSRFANGTDVVIVSGGEAHAGVVQGGVATGEVIAGTDIYVGLEVECSMRTNRITTQSQEGPGIDNTRRVVAVGMRVLESYPPDAGYDEIEAVETASFESSPYTGYARIPYNGDWGRDGIVTVNQSRPFPVTVLSLIPEVDAT